MAVTLVWPGSAVARSWWAYSSRDLAQVLQRGEADVAAEALLQGAHAAAGDTIVPGGSPIDVILNPGTRFHHNSAAQGKVALAFATDRQRTVWTRLISEKRRSETVLDHAVLWEQVAAVRKRGWSSAPEETLRGVNAVAAPVFGTGGEVAYTLALGVQNRVHQGARRDAGQGPGRVARPRGPVAVRM
ncbi:MAG: hypothetical protein JWP64_3384 [Pseudonocardia sp.]|jgi:DNA-binding IclR family transcriptional regulator|uniref:IclR family transcriptional regulator domain-containing protein n=1 Tax=Pseudonocardia sp. TaxID=60912 RepID=UPI00263503D2|nr:IclR family transcriptional regulator C-terminal domain-containing protein [Pseudonocardia sp.]MCU1628435.1 hypothetical protein [Pseudonocardia sp.]